MSRLLPLLLIAGCMPPRGAVIPAVPFSGATAVDLFRAVPDADKIHVQVDVGLEEPALFLVDTGASVSVVTQELASALGLEPEPQEGFLEGIGGTMRWSSVTIPRIRIGEAMVHDVVAATDITGTPRRMGAVPLDGILGNNVWRQFVMVLDYGGQRLELYDEEDAPVPDNSEPMLFDGMHCYAFVELEAATDGEPVTSTQLLAIDTGARGILLSGPSGEPFGGLGTEGEEPLFGIGSGERLPATSFMHRTRRIPLETARLGAATVEEPGQAQWVGFQGQRRVGPASMPGLVGYTVLKDHRVTFDFPGNRFSMEPSAAGEPTPPDSHQALLDQDLEFYGDDPHRGLRRARIQAWLEDYDAARETLEEYLEVNPESSEAEVFMARLLLFNGDVPGWLDVLGDMEAGTLLDESELVAAVGGNVLAGRLDEALALGEAGVAARPHSSDAYVALSDAMLAAGRYNEARRALVKANRLDESPDGHLLRRARLATLEGDHWGAVTHARRLLEVYPLSGFALWFYNHLVGQVDASDLLHRDLASAMARLHPEDRPLDFVAASLAALGDGDGALETYRQGMERDCADLEGDSHMNCRAWYGAMVDADIDGALQMSTQVTSLSPNRPDYLDTLAVAQWRAGQAEEAASTAHRAAALSPGDIYLTWQLDRMLQASEGD